MAQINKITIGYVIQVWDTEAQAFTSQEFVAGGEVEYEDAEDGSPIDIDDADIEELFNNYLPFDMVQPQTEGEQGYGDL